MLEPVTQLDQKLRGMGIPIDGVSVVESGYRIDFQISATDLQRSQAETIAEDFVPLTVEREWDQFHADLINPNKGGQVYSTLLYLSAFPAPGDSGCATALATLAATINSTSKNMAMDDSGKYWAMQGAIDFLVGVLKSRSLYTADVRQLLRDLLDVNGFADISVQPLAA